MLTTCSAQPLSFLRNASLRRCSGMFSKPDSTTVSNVPVAVASSVKVTRVVGSAYAQANREGVRQRPASYGTVTRERLIVEI
jgi:hypothetical protein